ncbi:MAG: CsfB protein [Clostridiales bacterium]|nr:CsfB protein [Clostridiales bacterium]
MEKKCVLCGQVKKENLMILGHHICADCEWKIVVARVHDAGYQEYVKAVSKVLSRSVKGA